MPIHKKLPFYLFSVIGAALLFFGTGLSPVFAAGTNRLSGNTRYQTAVEVAKQGWPNGADTVIVVRGREFADALTGTPLAYKLNAPILLTAGSNLTAATRQEIQRLHASKVIILGGPNAVSSHVASQIDNLPGVQVKRIAGKNRFETAQKVAERLGNYSKAVVTDGYSFPDSLSIASYAAENGYPILLTRTSSLPTSTKEALQGVRHTYVIGGKQAVSGQVANDVPSPYRISGSNRYETAVDVVNNLFYGTDKAFVATGTSFADALSGSVLAAKQHAPILLVRQSAAPQAIQSLVKKHSFSHFTVLGGPSAVSKVAVQDILHPENKREKVVQDAKALNGAPYRWGGTTPSGFDCSGFVDYVFKENGIDLHHSSSYMWRHTKHVSQPKPGDLVFYNTSGNSVSHVGIYIGNGKFISATSPKDGVKISPVHGKYYWGNRYVGAANPY